MRGGREKSEISAVRCWAGGVPRVGLLHGSIEPVSSIKCFSRPVSGDVTTSAKSMQPIFNSDVRAHARAGGRTRILVPVLVLSILVRTPARARVKSGFPRPAALLRVLT